MRFKKWKRRFSKYRSKRRYGSTRRGRIRKTGFTSKVRRSLFKIAESKYADVQYGPFNLIAGNPSALFSQTFSDGVFIPQGTAKNQRIGDSIFVTKIVYKFTVQSQPTGNGVPNANQGVGPFFLRILLYCNRAGGRLNPLDWAGDPPAINNLHSYDIIDRENVYVFADKLYSTDTQTFYNTKGSNVYGQHRLVVRINKRLKSQGGNWDRIFYFGGVYTNDNRIAGAGITFNVNGTLRVYYKDI